MDSLLLVLLFFFFSKLFVVIGGILPSQYTLYNKQSSSILKLSQPNATSTRVGSDKVAKYDPCNEILIPGYLVDSFSKGIVLVRAINLEKDHVQNALQIGLQLLNDNTVRCCHY